MHSFFLGLIFLRVFIEILHIKKNLNVVESSVILLEYIMFIPKSDFAFIPTGTC